MSTAGSALPYMQPCSDRAKWVISRALKLSWSVLRPHADDRGAPAAAGGRPGRPDGLGPAHALDRVVGAAAVAELPDPLGHVGAGLDDVGRAGAQGQVGLLRRRVDRDDPAGAGDPGALHGREADPAEAEDDHRLARPHPGRVAHGADAGEHGAAEQRRLGSGMSDGTGMQAVGVDGGLAREPADAEPRVDLGAVGQPAHAAGARPVRRSRTGTARRARSTSRSGRPAPS